MAFEYPTNFSNGTEYLNVEGIGSFFQYTNYATGGWFGSGVLGIIFFMVFMVSMSAGSRKALLASSFITFVFSTYFALLGLVSPFVVFGLIVLTIVGAIGTKSETNY